MSAHEDGIQSSYRDFAARSLAERAASHAARYGRAVNLVKAEVWRHAIDPQVGAGSNDGRRVLDIGCGRGGDVHKLSRLGVRLYVGVDLVAERIDEAKRRIAQLGGGGGGGDSKTVFRVFPADFLDPRTWPDQEMRSAAAQYDVVAMHFCLHYFLRSAEDVDAWMAHVARWLAPGGRWVVTCVDSARLWALVGSGKPWTANRLASAHLLPAGQQDGRWLKYHFRLPGSVDADEAFVDVPWVSGIAARHGLRLYHQAPLSAVHQHLGDRRDSLDADERELLGLYQVLMFVKLDAIART